MLAEPFTKERGMLSAKMSIKRRVVIGEYTQLLRSMYVDEMHHKRGYDESDEEDFGLKISG